MKIWVTGAGGMLGTEVSALLREWQIPSLLTGHEVDIGDPGAVAAFAGEHAFTHLVNCAAYTQVDRAESDEAEAQRVNGDALGLLGRVATDRGASVLHISTDYVFSGTSDRAYTEEDSTAPLGAYGRTKRSGELQLIDACARHHIVRTSWLFGAHGRSFVSTMLQLMASRAELGVVADQHGRPTAASDLAQAALAVAGIGPPGTGAAPFGLYHFACGPPTTWHGFASAIRAEASRQGVALQLEQLRPIGTADYPTPATRPQRSILDTTKIEGALGRPCPDWSVALAQVVAARCPDSMPTDPV